MVSQAPETAVTLLLLDDHEAPRKALARRLLTSSGIVLVGETDDTETALALCRQHRPMTALVDPRRSDGMGFEAIARLARVDGASPPLIAVHAAYYDAAEWRMAQQAGAVEWLLKQFDVEALVKRVRAMVCRRDG